MLEAVEATGDMDIVSFLPHGRAFKIHDAERFTNEILPKYFRHSKWVSFSRQLSLYGFRRVRRESDDPGAYYHELFLRGRRGICLCMRRVGVPHDQCDRRKLCRKMEKAPDFYAMKALVKKD
jgi:hypothetical protein